MNPTEQVESREGKPRLGKTILLGSGKFKMRVSPELGGRIVSFRLGEREVLTGPEVVAGGQGDLPNMFGSTFWTSPQAAWGWPPEAEVDSLEYAARAEGDALILTGEAGATTGYAVSKRFKFDEALECFEVEYRMLNRGAKLAAAPWEISRVHKCGYVLFPSQSEATAESSLPSEVLDGVAWVDISKAPSGDAKLFQDGSEGWLAYVSEGLVLIKTFENVDRSQQAEGEAEVEIFISGDYDYVELEQQGRYEKHAAGQEPGWTVGWWLRALPEGLQVVPGNNELVDWIRQQIAGGKQ